jgi:LmbE family N-acetylglucosaminyl deacetylase
MIPGNILMMATYGMEIVECGGLLARHAQAGATVTAAVALADESIRPQIDQAAKILGVSEIYYLDWQVGKVELNPSSKLRLVSLIRQVRPDIFICMDPDHAEHDLDPDRRIFSLLYLESLALAGREWGLKSAGSYEAYTVPGVYFMSPEQPNCIVEISEVVSIKEKALAELHWQHAAGGAEARRKYSEAFLRQLLPNYAEIAHDDVLLGSAIRRCAIQAEAIYNGLGGHSGAILGEPYRRIEPFVMEYLVG